MPDMSEYPDTEDQMEGRADSMRKAEKEGDVPPRRKAIVDPRTGCKYPVEEDER